MPKLTCLRCRTRFQAPEGEPAECPNCGKGSPLDMDDPKAGNAPNSVRWTAFGDAGFAALLFAVGVIFILVGANPDAEAWNDIGLGAIDLGKHPDLDRAGIGATGWDEMVLYGVGGGLVLFSILHTLMLVAYMRERNWARIMRTTFGVIETPAIGYCIWYLLTDAKGRLTDGETTFVMILLLVLSIFSIFAMNQSATWEWFHPDAEPDRR